MDSSWVRPHDERRGRDDRSDADELEEVGPPTLDEVLDPQLASGRRLSSSVVGVPDPLQAAEHARPGRPYSSCRLRAPRRADHLLRHWNTTNCE